MSEFFQRTASKPDIRYYLLRIVPLAAAVILLIVLITVGISSAAPAADFIPMETVHVTRSEVLESQIPGTDHLNIVQQYVEENKCYITNEPLEVKGLMLHSIGVELPNAQIFARNYNTAYPFGSAICTHAFLQSDGTVYQILPWDIVSWHSGGSANETHIGIEMCEPDTIVYTDVSTFYCTDEQAAKTYVVGAYDTAVSLFAELCMEYNLDPLEEGVILSHAEGNELGVASDHGDPEHLWKGLGLPYTMDTFRADVAARIAALQ